MKLREKIKRFCRLDVHNHEGFTLVELIIVIAILAILSSVAVVGYSSYVTKANKQADLTLMAEIEKALILAGYSPDGFQDGDAGYILLTCDEAFTSTICIEDLDDDALDAALKASFGENYSFLLKYNGWDVKNMVMSQEAAEIVVNSTFAQAYTPDELMAQVQAVTSAVNGLKVDAFGETQTLYKMFAYKETDVSGNTVDKNAIDDVLADYNIDKSWDELTSTEKTNLLVLATAASVSSHNGAAAASTVADFSEYTAYAAVNPEFNEAYKTFQQSISQVEDADDEVEAIKAAYNTLKAAAGEDFEEWKSNADNKDLEAFISIMSGVGDAMKDNGAAILGELNNPDMFTSGVGYDMYNDYLNSAYATAGMSEQQAEMLDLFKEAMAAGEMQGVLIWYSMVGSTLYIDSSLPLNDE